EGKVSRTKVGRPGRSSGAGHTLRVANSPQEPRLCNGLRSRAGTGDWSQYRHVQCAECGAAPAASLSIPGTVGDVVERGSESKPSRRQDGLCERRTVAASKQELRGHGGLRSCFRYADNAPRGGTDRGTYQCRQDLTQLVSLARRSALARPQL